jgi:hypothetical protein
VALKVSLRFLSSRSRIRACAAAVNCVCTEQNSPRLWQRRLITILGDSRRSGLWYVITAICGDPQRVTSFNSNAGRCLRALLIWYYRGMWKKCTISDI